MESAGTVESVERAGGFKGFIASPKLLGFIGVRV